MGTTSTPDRRNDPTVPGYGSADIHDYDARRSAARCAELQERVAELQTALDSRVVIEQAKGVLAERHGLTVDVAFTILRRYARDHNLRIHDLAADVVNGHRLASGAVSTAS